MSRRAVMRGNGYHPELLPGGRKIHLIKPTRQAYRQVDRVIRVGDGQRSSRDRPAPIVGDIPSPSP